MSGRLLLSSPKPHVPSLTPYGSRNDTPDLGFQAADRSEALTFLHRWKTESNIKEDEFEEREPDLPQDFPVLAGSPRGLGTHFFFVYSPRFGSVSSHLQQRVLSYHKG